MDRARNCPMIEDLGLMEARDRNFSAATSYFQQARTCYAKRDDLLRVVLEEADAWIKQNKPKRALALVRSVLRVVPDAPAARYRAGLRALADYIKSNFAGKSFRDLAPEDQDKVLKGLESGSIALKDVKSADFFTLLLGNTQEGFFADPIYGGNRDMASWKLIGFPGARYDYRDWVDRHNEPYPLPPVSLSGRPDWTRL